MKKNKMYLLIVVIIINIIVVVSANEIKFPFEDLSTNAWYYDEVKTVYNAGIMEGKTSTSFDPTANMSRAEFVTVLCRLSDEAYEGKGNNLNFSDTDKDAWYADYVGWGVETEMVKGLPGNKFAPNQAVSRQEMAVFIDRFISYMNIELTDNSKVETFNDKSNVTDYAKAAVETMRKSGIITGDQNGNFNPINNASRAEVATVITRILPLLDKVGSESGNIIPNVRGEFVLMEQAEAPLSYFVYIPDNYNESNKYPVIIYSYDNGNTSINNVDVLFSHSESPAYGSIVIIPNTTRDSDYKTIDELIDYIKLNYSTDNERIYMIALNDQPSTFFTWEMLIEKPELISAVIFVHGVSAPLGTDGNGQNVLLDEIAYNRLPDKLKEISISIVHCTDDPRSGFENFTRFYGTQFLDALKYSGFENVILTENISYSKVFDNFINENDRSQLEWLFAQRRETK